MMESTQARFARLLNDIAEDAGLEIMKDSTYSNVGTWMFVRPGGFEPVLAIGFDFQTGYVKFTDGQLGRVLRATIYKPEELGDALAAIRQALANAAVAS